jgi:hypothetical protein
MCRVDAARSTRAPLRAARELGTTMQRARRAALAIASSGVVVDEPPLTLTRTTLGRDASATALSGTPSG